MLRLRQIPKLLKNRRCLATKQGVLQTNDEYNEVAQYPPILDTSYEAKKLSKIQQWHKKIKNLNTIEEKLLEINMSRYYGHPCLMMSDQKFPYNTMPFIQYCTRTDFKENLPEFYNAYSEKSESFLNLIKTDLKDALNFEYEGYL